MGKHSNFILLDDCDIIINSLRHLSTSNGSNRDILPKFKYLFPTSNKLDLLSYNNFDDFEELFNEKNTD